MYLGLIEAKYDYQMSYLDQWANAWKKVANKTVSLNITQNSDLKILRNQASKFDLLVVLHSVNADSNLWLKKIADMHLDSRAPMVMFVGNEFSSPFLSTESRLKLISDIHPEIIATQIPLSCAEWLYGDTGSCVVSAPPGLPEMPNRQMFQSRRVDFGYRGFTYPWYLLDEDRNLTINSVMNFFKKSMKNLDVSFTHRFKGPQWFEFLESSYFTASSEAGSQYVFRNDDVWRLVQDYFLKIHKFSVLKNDATGMSVLRQLPSPLKRLLKQITSAIGVKQASLYKPSPEEALKLTELVNPSKFEHRSGKAISSRHFDAIACGTWQILKPGSYNDILIPNMHYTPWNPADYSEVLELMSNLKYLEETTQRAYQSLCETHSYQTRVERILAVLR